MGAPQGIEIAPASEFHEVRSIGGWEAAISLEISKFSIFPKTMVQSSSAAANSFFDLTSAFESGAIGLDGKITENSNESTDFKDFEVEGVARRKTISDMQAENHLGVGITRETTALQVT